MRLLVGTLALTVLLMGVGRTASASEADELRAKAKAVRHEAEVLAKEGKKEESQKLFRVVKELLAAAEKHEAKPLRPSNSPDREIEELHQQLKAIGEKEGDAKVAKNKDALIELQKHRAKIERHLEELRDRRESKSGLKHADKHVPEASEKQQATARR